ncbi:hypothetical protein BOTBODRAFT_376727 [Botryobasidium botryosum FD-172 SS1]|uniref:Uncharacterized protein n=1 Tax=Botryobasidium botryosum (strain FD-172 SS1) TaxID=930990 RepID=A0A067MVK7_BOTB1|nr:hypothetical protein BOTBODRAFT_376727 [Botryobasidium botryosum FD-172 SS1]
MADHQHGSGSPSRGCRDQRQDLFVPPLQSPQNYFVHGLGRGGRRLCSHKGQWLPFQLAPVLRAHLLFSKDGFTDDTSLTRSLSDVRSSRVTPGWSSRIVLAVCPDVRAVSFHPTITTSKYIRSHVRGSLRIARERLRKRHIAQGLRNSPSLHPAIRVQRRVELSLHDSISIRVGLSMANEVDTQRRFHGDMIAVDGRRPKTKGRKKGS